MSFSRLLSKCRLGANCADGDIAVLSEIAQERQVADGQWVFLHGEEARELMVISSGTVQLELPLTILGVSKNVPFERKHAGDVIGWSALVAPYRFTLSARALGGVSVAVFPRDELTALFESDTGLGYRIMRNLASITGERLHHTQVMWSGELQRALDERYR